MRSIEQAGGRTAGHRLALVFICTVGLATSARAISLPVDGTYGAGAGCAIVAANGMAAMVRGGGTEAFPESRQQDSEDIVVTPTHVVGSDWVCEAGTVDGSYVALLCVTEGATWIPMPVARFNVRGDTLRFTMPDEPTVVLDRCRSQGGRGGRHDERVERP